MLFADLLGSVIRCFAQLSCRLNIISITIIVLLAR